jgi:AcrR family transcriptional regulator
MTVPGDETRTRILEAAWGVVRRDGTAEVTIAAIANASGVSRQLIYFHFGNRAGLLTAMARHRDETSALPAEAAASRRMDPVPGLERLLRAWFAHVPDILPVARALEAALITGDEGGTAWRDRLAELHEALRIAFDRLDRHGQLAEGWTVEDATDWTWATVQPGMWDYLVGERGWKPADYVDDTIDLIVGRLVSQPAPAPAS